VKISTNKEPKTTMSLSLPLSLWERAAKTVNRDRKTYPSLTAFVRQAVEEKLERMATEARATASEGD